MTPPQSRVAALDALRGLAALSVIAYHLSTLLPNVNAAVNRSGPDAGVWWAHTPLVGLVAGHNAVMFFFVLSGFALAAMQRRVPDLGAFLTRRAARIYPPYLLALVLGAAFSLTQGPLTRLGYAGWIQAHVRPQEWSLEFLNLFVAHALLVTPSGDPVAFVPGMWSLRVEIIMSALFPLLAFTVRRWPVTALLVLAVVTPLAELLSALEPLRYAWLFALGLLVHDHRQALTEWLACRGRRWATLTLGVSLYTLMWLLPASVQGAVRNETFDVTVGVGAALVMAAVLASSGAQRALAWGPLRWLGRVSYSLYLYGLLIQVVVFRSLPHAPYALNAALTVGAAFGAAQLSYHFVERRAARRG